MAIPESEASACLEILVAMMKADGRVDPAEKKSLAAALEAFEMHGASVEKLLEAPVDVDAALARITSAEARDQAYRSAYFMAHADVGDVGKRRRICSRRSRRRSIRRPDRRRGSRRRSRRNRRGKRRRCSRPWAGCSRSAGSARNFATIEGSDPS